MEPISILTEKHKIILNLVSQEPELVKSFYFTGGTALTEFYLHHRYSEDLDFFSKTPLENQYLSVKMHEWSEQYQFTFQSRFIEVVYIFNLTFADGEQLKVDFGYYPYKQLEKGTTYKSIPVDSELDIAINKLNTISQRTEIKDFVDLYFLLQKYSVYDLMEGVKVKFQVKVEPFLLAADMLKVEDFTYLPRMVTPLPLDTLKDYYRKQARAFGLRTII
ncbi:nucleotidyl transferase AbiEii/AbiGii toxin family protein [Candidatus Roizmanbacteria bacterium]|nr:nucleotidyl transferase AbiEii/AbiGii toxin family protein [Candidatus Roizmanbacteria bacterium]